MGRGIKSPPQFGQTPNNISSTHDAQNVHSKLQIIASFESFANGFLQFSQFGRISNIYKF